MRQPTRVQELHLTMERLKKLPSLEELRRARQFKQNNARVFYNNLGHPVPELKVRPQ